MSEVIAPFRLTSGETLLVDRGYVSFVDVRSGRRRSRRCRPGRSRSPAGCRTNRSTRPTGPPFVVGDRVEAYAISSARCGQVGAGGYVRLTRPRCSCRATSSSPPDSPGVLTPIDLPQTDSGPFLSYALQWAAFGVIALIGLGVFIYREAVDPRPPDDSMRTQLTPSDASAIAADPSRTDRNRRDADADARDGFDRSQLYDE